MTSRRWLWRAVSVLAIGGFALRAGAAPPAAPGPAGPALLAVDTQPADAHVYLRGPASKDLVGPCTGPCLLQLEPGSYRVAAGLFHAQLTTAEGVVSLAPGERQRVLVSVRENRTRTGLVGGLVLGGAIVGLVDASIVLARGGPDAPGAQTPTTTTLAVTALVSMLAGVVLAEVLDEPIVVLSGTGVRKDKEKP